MSQSGQAARLERNFATHWLRGADPVFLVAAVALIVVGVMAIYSVSAAAPQLGLFRRQIMLLAMGLAPLALFWLVPAQVWQRTVNWLYAANVLLLGMVLVAGSEGGGAQRWLDIGPVQFQPSEMSKILTVITLSAFFHRRREAPMTLGVFLLSFLHVLPPLVLIFRQPHLGATLTILVAWLAICVVARVPWKYILGFLAGMVILGAAAGATLLQGYQMERLNTLFSRDKDNRSDHYQQDQAMIAIGLGGVWGEGYLKGDQRERRAVPEQHNDFIFTVIGEEGGLFGSTLVLAAFGVFFIRGWMLALRMSDLFSRLATMGCLTVLAFHWFVNMAMNLGIGPVVGLWLPFISAGGTALWLCLACVGLIMNLNARAMEGVFSGGRAPSAWLDQG